MNRTLEESNVLFCDSKQLEILVSKEVIKRPIETKKFTACTIFRNATRIVFGEARKYAMEKDYQIAYTRLGYDPAGCRWASLEVDFYKL